MPTEATAVAVNDLGERFALEYLKDLNATEAYLRTREGVAIKRTTAGQEGYKLLKNPQIAERISQLQKERMRRLHLDADRVLDELSLVAFSDVRHYEVDDDGRLQLNPGVDDAASRAVSSVKRKITVKGEAVEHQIEYRLWPKVQALDILARHLRLLPNAEADSNQGATLTVVFRKE